MRVDHPLPSPCLHLLLVVLHVCGYRRERWPHACTWAMHHVFLLTGAYAPRYPALSSAPSAHTILVFIRCSYSPAVIHTRQCRSLVLRSLYSRQHAFTSSGSEPP
jgi:hypothetical protein